MYLLSSLVTFGVTIRDRDRLRQDNLHEYILLTDAGERKSYREVENDDLKEDLLKVMQDGLCREESYIQFSEAQWQESSKEYMDVGLKQRENSVKSRYKARLVIKDLHQPKGVDFWEIFSCHLDVINLSGTRISR